MPRVLPLDARHRALGASMQELGGLEVPSHYGDEAAEYRAFREGTALVDRSALGKVVVTGRDRQVFLQGMLTNEVKSLTPGQGTAAGFLDAHGKVMALLRVYVLADRLWLELPPGLTGGVLRTIDRYLISEKAYFEAADEQFVALAVQGPGASGLLGRLTGQALDLAPYQHVEASIAGASLRVAQRSEGAGPGYHCWVAPADALGVWDALVDAGARAAGHRALEAYRVESGVPWYGVDVDEGQILPETGLEDLVSYTKGCYIGQEVVARVKYRGHVNRALTGLVLDGDEIPDRGARITAEARDVGWLTSGVRSPALGRVVALGYVRREHLAPGTPVSVDLHGRAISARVAELPFVKTAR